eukprot:TRINITY_DN37109_c0_g1_i1.p1 TRINITY_DN37109_c0_g1~~TRINITY_DN37109_c0_g1_i1.p1  ORF type:complete len:499 (+),score=124.10 TRINITY_DN37109_c0_g1_i1:126-1499(+)
MDEKQTGIEREIHEQDMRDTLKTKQEPTRGGVKYERGSSTKLRKGDVLCPDNVKLINILTRYANLCKQRGNIDLYDAYALSGAGILDNIRRFAAPITTADDAKHLKLKFISGAARTDLRDRLEELQLHGDIAELQEDPAVTARKLFQSIPGLTHLADDFVFKGYRTMDDLQNSPEAAKWSEQQRREIEYFEDMRSRIACQEGVLMGMLLQDTIAEYNKDVRFSETTSVRRRELWSRESEMRFLITHPELPSPDTDGPALFKDIISHLLSSVNGAHEWEAWLSTDTSVILKGRIPPVFSDTRWRKIALMWVPHKEWVPSLLEYTGHARFTERLADRMKQKGWRLTPTAVYNPDGEVVVFDTEEELFEAINEPFVPSWDRTEQGPQLNRRNNDFSFVGGEYKEKPRAHRVRNHKGRRPSYHELLRRKEVNQHQVDKGFDFNLTNFEDGFNKESYSKRLK